MKKNKYYFEGALLTILYLVVAGTFISFQAEVATDSLMQKILLFPAEITLNPFYSETISFQGINFSIFGLYFLWSFFCVGLDLIKSALRTEKKNLAKIVKT